MTDEEIDTSDIPPLDDAFFAAAQWLGGEDSLTDNEKSLLEVRLASYKRTPDAGSSWEEVEARIQSRIKGI